ncbi:hypothetical protein BH10PLA1_BH10PLA1_00870 [soil metagenome]
MAIETKLGTRASKKDEVQALRASKRGKRLEQLNQKREATEAPCAPAPVGFICALRDVFRRLASHASAAMGSPWTFVTALTLVLVWAVLGPHFQYSENWQLVINTGTTIITFLMIFLVQNTQNRDSRAIHLKLDELLHGVKGARSSLVDLEDATDEELEALRIQFKAMRSRKHEEDEKQESSE